MRQMDAGSGTLPPWHLLGSRHKVINDNIFQRIVNRFSEWKMENSPTARMAPDPDRSMDCKREEQRKRDRVGTVENNSEL